MTKILIIDGDPIFRLGLCTALESFTDLEIIGQADREITALNSLQQQVPDLVILEPSGIEDWQFYQQIKQEYPEVKICLFSNSQNYTKLLEAKDYGVEAYFPKGKPIEELVDILREIIAGETNWNFLENIQPTNNQFRQAQKQQKQWLIQMRQSGLKQIEDNLAQVKNQVDRTDLPLLDYWFWQGRKRELLAARWLVKQLLPVAVVVIPETSSQAKISQERQEISSLVPVQQTSIIPRETSQLSAPANVFENTINKIDFGLENSTNIPLEIDILKPNKKRELLYIALNKIRIKIEELRFLKITIEDLSERKNIILQDLWQNCVLDFTKNYYDFIPQINQEIILNELSEELQTIQIDILSKIPFLLDLFNFFLFNKGLLIDSVDYRPEAPEAIARAEIILQNLTLQIANGVMVVILNNFADLEQIKQILYNQNKLSSREIARFRNDLSWKYRSQKYWQDPRDIFESQYRLFYCDDSRIKTTFIYAPRQEELKQLRGIPWAVTIVLELRDAIAPRLRSLTAFLGNALVYLLTQIIGRGLGLIGRGIIQGIGTTLQETRYGKTKKQKKVTDEG